MPRVLNFAPLGTLQSGCPVPGPSLAGCFWTFFEAPLSPLLGDTILDNLRLTQQAITLSRLAGHTWTAPVAQLMVGA